MSTESILNKYWKQNQPNTIIDSSFVETVILPAMEEYRNTSLSVEQIKALKELYSFVHKDNYNKADVIKLLISFGEQVSFELTGIRMSMIGELSKWSEENL